MFTTKTKTFIRTLCSVTVNQVDVIKVISYSINCEGLYRLQFKK